MDCCESRSLAIDVLLLMKPHFSLSYCAFFLFLFSVFESFLLYPFWELFESWNLKLVWLWEWKRQKQQGLWTELFDFGPEFGLVEAVVFVEAWGAVDAVFLA